jgi:hypothetical protein
MTALPTSVRVGYADFTVIDWPYMEAISNDADGECHPQTRIIRIRSDLNPGRKACVLLHEILHAAYQMGDLSGGESEEKIVTVLAHQMTQVWRDNPDFVRFMEASLGREP